MKNLDDTQRYVSRLTQATLALVLAGGRGSRLKHLTLQRAKPAAPFGGKFRIIDFPLSNCVNSGIRRIAVLTQYKAHQLILHIQRGWSFLAGRFNEFVELLPAQQRIGGAWYLGTADAVYQNLDIIRGHKPEFVLVLAGDHIYKMDYGPMIAHHVETGADITVGCIEVPRERAREFGVMAVDENLRVRKFLEKPENPEPMPGREDVALASMGIYVFSTQFLCDELARDAADPNSAHDFGKDVVPANVAKGKTVAYPFLDVHTRAQHYWRDVGNVDAFFEANMELVHVNPELNLYDENWPIWTFQQQLPPAKFVLDEEGRRGHAVNSLVSGGCIVSGAAVEHSLLFYDVRIEACSHLQRCVVLPGVRIGERCRIKNAVIDERCVIADDTVIGEDRAQDEQRFFITKQGVVLVTPDMLGQETGI
ncbi:MAG: glucose-1-phosphate adenylyltransferase [Planctomycetota bacterium]